MTICHDDDTEWNKIHHNDNDGEMKIISIDSQMYLSDGRWKSLTFTISSNFN